MMSTVITITPELQWMLPLNNQTNVWQNPLNAIAQNVQIETGTLSAKETDLADVRKSLDGDEAAYARIMRRYQETITAQMWRFTRDPLELEELVHDVFVQAFLSLKKFRGDAPFIHWLRRVATFTGYKYWDKKAKHQDRHVDISELCHLASDHPEDKKPDEAAEILFKMLERLKPKDRLILTLHYFDGYDMQEVADQLGWNRTIVKVRAHRARNTLKKWMEQAGYRRQES